MKRLLVIGFGNPLRGDDGVGYRLAKALEELEGEDLVCLCLLQLTPELATEMSNANEVWFLDAEAEGEPGAISCRRLQPLESISDRWTHDLSPQGLLDLCASLYAESPRTLLMTIAGESFDLSETLSRRVRESAQMFGEFLSKSLEENCIRERIGG